MNIKEFEEKKRAFREDIRPSLNALSKKALFFDDNFNLSNLPTDKERIFTSIRAIIQFSFLYPNVRVYYQLAKYLALASLIEEAYFMMTHTTIIIYSFLQHVGVDFSKYETFHFMGFEFEHLVYLLSKSSTYEEYLEGFKAFKSTTSSIVNEDIPFICYKREMSNLNINYFFANQSLDIAHQIQNGEINNDIKFVRGRILNMISDDKSLVFKSSDGDSQAELLRVSHAEIDENLYLRADILDDNDKLVKCYMKIQDTQLVDYDCGCTKNACNYDPCKHIRILNNYLVFVLSSYFFFGQN